MALRVLLALSALSAPTAAVGSAATMEANPIRKVVSLLQALQKKVEAEGASEEELYRKFECYCSSGSKDLGDGISGAETRLPQLESSIAASEEQKAQLEAEVKQAKGDRASAQATLAEAAAIRAKDAAAFAAYKAEAGSNVAALEKAVAAIERGAGSFLQTAAAQQLRSLLQQKQDLPEDDRQVLASFLEGSSQYAPQSGEVTGILKQLAEEMGQGLSEAASTEEAAVAAFQGLTAAKEREVEALSEAIESKIQRLGELGVAVVQLKGDLKETGDGLAADRQFLGNLESTCASKKAEWEERQRTRADELVALADTIKLLNDDDALDLFKATLPGHGTSFVQLAATTAEVRARALEVVRAARRTGARSNALMDRILMALHGKQAGFEKVVQMVDGMVELLKKEQIDDDKKKQYCGKQFDDADDKKKALDRSVSDTQAAISKAEETIARLTEEITSLDAGIKELDKSVAQATEQRQKEHEEYIQLIASNNAAKQLLGLAKNRLNKFYNPKLYAAPAKKELSAEDRIAANMAPALVQVAAHVQHGAAPASPPSTFEGAYGKKTEESAGVIAMLDLLIKDLDKEITEAEAEEKHGQADYETLMKDSAEKRTQDAKSLAQKEDAKADTQADLESLKSSKASTTQELMATLEYIQGLHSECDWLLHNFDARKEARTGEIDSLKKAKAVLSGASYSLLETGSRRAFLKRST